MTRCMSLVAGLVWLTSSVAFAGGLSLDVTPGLWQVSTEGSATGTPDIPPEALAKMTPEQRAMALAMALLLVTQAGIPHTLQICITEDQIQRGFDLTRVGKKDCAHEVRSSSPTHLDMHVACGGKSPFDGTLHLTATDHRTVSGDLDLRAGATGAGLTIRQTVRGRWLGAACGDVRPIG